MNDLNGAEKIRPLCWKLNEPICEIPDSVSKNEARNRKHISLQPNVKHQLAGLNIRNTSSELTISYASTWMGVISSLCTKSRSP